MQYRFMMSVIGLAAALYALAPEPPAEANIEAKKGSVSVSLVGAIPLLRAKLLAESFLLGNLALGLIASFANSPFSTYESKSISVQGRRFFMSSFYMAAGLSYVDQYNRFDELLTPDPQWFMRDRSLCLRLAIGNQKSHPSGFFFGAEWAEVGVPLMRIGEPTLSSSREVAESTRAEQERKAKSEAAPFEFGAARLFLGYRF